jgi:hypothetical protein
MTTVPDRPRRRWDDVLTVLLMMALVLWCTALGFAGAFDGMLVTACDGRCDDGLLQTGVLVASLGQVVVALAAISAAALATLWRRLAFWIPLVAAAVAFGVLLLGDRLVHLALPPLLP